MTPRGAITNLDHAFGALAHPVRRRILESTIRSGRGVTELTDEFDISLAAVSKHVKVLERAGLVSREIHGRDHVIRARVQEFFARGAGLDRAADGILGARSGPPEGRPRDVMTSGELRVEVTPIIRAPRERVFDAWLAPDRLARFLCGEIVKALAAGVYA